MPSVSASTAASATASVSIGASAAVAADRHRTMNIKGGKYLHHFFYYQELGDLVLDGILILQRSTLLQRN
ncbi:MAG: hypothetical protein WAM14_05910 [Candidatus Nitrosopolaris sp.]